MVRIHRWAWPVMLVLCTAFVVSAMGCKTTKANKEYDDTYQPEPDPEPGPGPHPPT